MAGIVVVYDPGGARDRIREFAQAMCQRLQRSDREGPIEQYVRSGLGIGRCRPALTNRTPQPAWNEGRTICLVFHGELFGHEDLSRRLRQKGYSFSNANPAELVIHLYEESGDAFVRELNGSFALALWDSRQQKLLVANDRYSLCPLYHARSEGAYVWASSPKAILSSPAFQRRVNLAAMADFMCLGIPQGNDTMFEGIDEVPPASLVICHEGQVRSQQYWDLSLQEDETGIPAEDYLQELIFLLRQASERRQGGELSTGLLLSGGYDSRAALSVSRKDAITAFTFGIPDCDDIRYARQAAKVAHVPHVALRIESGYLKTFARAGIQRTEDLISCSRFHGISVYDQVASQVNALITGSVGEDVFGHFVRDPQDEFWSDGFSADRYYDAKCITTDTELEQLLRPAYYRSLKGLARARFRRDIERYSSRHVTNVVDYWSISQQQRRLYNRLSSLFPDNLGFRPLYLDNDLIDFVQAVPPSMRWGKDSIYKQVLQRAAPGLARIPLTTTWGLPLDASHRQIARQKRLKACWRRWCSRANRLSAGLIQPARMASYGVDYGRWLRSELRGWAESILLDVRTLERGYWDPCAIERLIQDHLLGRGRQLTQKLTALITFELWHRMYIDESDTMPFTPRSASAQEN